MANGSCREGAAAGRTRPLREGLVAAMVLLWAGGAPDPASSQTLDLKLSAGPTIGGGGSSAALEAGVTVGRVVAAVVGVEYVHLAFQQERSPDGVFSTLRGGTVRLVTLSGRFALPGVGRLSPFVQLGVAAGRSRPTVNTHFPDAVTNDARGVVLAGGGTVRLTHHLGATLEGRVLFGGEATETLFIPAVRAGLAWRF